MRFNICSFGANTDYLNALFDNGGTHPHILVLSEYWFYEEIINELAYFQGYNTAMNNWKSGGVVIYLIT